MLFRVLQGGLKLGKYLGMTAGRANILGRDCPSHPRPGSSSRRRGNEPHTADPGVRVSL